MVRVIFLNPPSNMPAYMADLDGAYSLDLQPKELIALTKVIDDYIEIGSIKQDTFKEIEIPVSKKNRLLFQNVGNPNAINKTNAEIFNIQLLKGDFTYPSQGIQIVDYDDTSNTWSCTIFGDLNEWYKPLSQLYLNDLELGAATYGQPLLEQQIDLPVYQDGNLPIYSTVVNFGQWFINYNKTDNSIVPSQLVLNDFRYFHSPYAILKQAFCQVGYTLEAPVFDTKWFRSLWCYLLDPDFEFLDDEITLLDREIDLIRIVGTLQFTSLFAPSSTGKEFNGVVLWGTGDSILDVGNHAIIRPTCGTCPIEDFYGTFYAGGMKGSFRFQGTARLTATNASPWTPVSPSFITITCSIRKCSLYGINSQDDLIAKSEVLQSSQIVDKGTIVNGVVKNYAFDIETGDIKTYQHDVIFVHFEYTATLADSGGLTITESDLIPMTDLLNGYSFTNTVQRGVIEEGDTFEIANQLNKSYTSVDILKGITHLLNLKLETDSYNKIVRLYPEFDINLFKDGKQQGFFFDNATDVVELTHKVQANSMKQSFRNNELGRNVELKFKGGNDGYISGLDLEQELHGKYIDLGSDYKEAKNELINPLFSPTASTTDGQLTKQSNTTLDGAANYIPYIWEYSTQGGTSYPEKGFNINPRILFAYSPDNPAFDKFESTYVFADVSGIQQDFPFGVVYQDSFRRDLVQPFSQIMPNGVRSYTSLVSDPATLQELTETIVYGNGVEEIREDLYNIIYRRAITQAYFRIALEFLVMLDLADFQNLSFRRKVHLKYKSGAFGEIDIFARVSRVTDYVIGGNITTPVQLLPDGNTFACDVGQ